MKAIRILLLLSIVYFSLFCKDTTETAKPELKIFCKGDVVETLNSNGYTYTLVKTDFEKYIWVASPELKVKAGDKVAVPNGSIMENFTSKTLNKTFPHILFVSYVAVEGADATSVEAIQKNAGKTYCPPTPTDNKRIEPGSIKKASGGYTVSECFAKSAQLSGKNVIVRGKVVKYSENIMNKNWIHLRDSSGGKENMDLTVTTLDKSTMGKTILVSGKLVRNRNLGAGYRYPVMIEEAKIIQE